MRVLPIILVLIFTLTPTAAKKSANVLNITADVPYSSFSGNYETDPNGNLFSVKLPNSAILENKFFFLILESSNADFVLSILNEERNVTKAEVLIDLTTFSGNIAFVMSSTFFNGKLDFFKSSGQLHFRVSNKDRYGDKNYKIRAEVSPFLTLPFGKTFTTRVDININNLEVVMNYAGTAHPDLQKLRFQVTAVRQKKDYSLSSTVSYKDNHFEMNTVFPKTVGGILSLPRLPVCLDAECEYRMSIRMSQVKVINIETYLIGKMEQLSIQHFEEYYDRVYDENKVTFYELPYEESMSEMDITISLIPVIGNTGLYVNVRTLPLELENFDWKEKGPLAKRITIKWAELVQMRGEKSNLYIAVQTSRPGEFLLKVDAHDPGYKGRLNSGIIESGFVQYEEINNYLYFFEVYESQTITFTVNLNIISGDADLYLKQCFSYVDCIFGQEQVLKGDGLRSENNQNSKAIAHEFSCDHNPKNVVSTCQFVVGVRGKENHGTHFEITLQEQNFHRFMVPAHSVPLSLSPEQIVYLKFSHPLRSDKAKLFLNVEALWGSFGVAISKKEQYPKLGNPETISQRFVATKLGLYNSLRTIAIEPTALGDNNIQGVYYVAVIANSSCSLNLKFFEKNDDSITIHTLVAGTQVRGEVTSLHEIAYYTIKVSLETEQASSVSVYLTPLKGHYLIFANRNGKLPTPESREFYSQNNHLELNYNKDSNTHDEYIIGVKLAGDAKSGESDSYQFMINLSYSHKALRLNPGIISQYLLSRNNYFFIEVAPEMKSVLILKSIVDGYSIKLCAWFTLSEKVEDNQPCTHNADDKNVALYIGENELDINCKRKSGLGKKCFLQLRVEGTTNQKFAIGFVYNDHPFQLTKQLVVTGPTLMHPNAQINFIYHAELNKSLMLYFNSKGRNIKVFTKLVRGEYFKDENALVFPTESAYDAENVKRNGYISSVYYNASTVAEYGSDPEVLISIRSAQNGEQMFDPTHYFVLQVSGEAQEILRTQTHTQSVTEGAWNYFTFYNNGNTDSLRVYITSPVMARLEVLLSRGLQSRPPFTNKAMASKIGMGSVDMSLTSSDLKTDPHGTKERLKGHYTLAVKSSVASTLNIFWNNKEDLNYVELTPNLPISMALEQIRPFYFSFYAQDTMDKLTDRGIVSIYIKTTSQASIYLLKTKGELEAPSAEHYTWKSNLAEFGGVTVIHIKPTDPEYCVECLYMGAIETKEDGQVSILANIRHSGIAIELLPGFTFPDILLPGERLLYRISNQDSNQVDLTVSMLSGFVSIFVSTSADVSEVKFDESHLLENRLDVHKFIPLVPSKFGSGKFSDFYLLITNTRQESASFTMSIDKNGLRSPIQPGITKYLHLGPSESTDLMYTPRDFENTFEVRFELRQILDDKYRSTALDNITRFLTLFHVDERGDRFPMKIKRVSATDNRAYFNFDISENKQGAFAIHLLNPLGAPIAASVDLLNGNYKLLNFNQFTVDRLRKKEHILYEGYGHKSKYVFVDLKMCHGEVEVEFFQNDFENVGRQNTTEFKKIIDSNSMVHYIKLEHERLFLKIKNRKESKAIYEMSVFNERDLDNNPYSEVAQGNSGKVDVELDVGIATFAPITISSTYSSEFYHVVNYTIYLSNEKPVLDYGKNCGRYMINHVWQNPHLLTFSTVTVFKSAAEIESFKKKIKLPISGLLGDTRYYGIVVARIDLYPKEGGFLSPTRSGKVYYDEFIFITAKFNIPLNLWVAILVCVGFFVFLFCLVKAYIFGSINKMRNFERLTDLAEFDDGMTGMKIMSALEREYYEEAHAEETAQEAQQPEPPKEQPKNAAGESVQDIEMNGSQDKGK